MCTLRDSTVTIVFILYQDQLLLYFPFCKQTNTSASTPFLSKNSLMIGTNKICVHLLILVSVIFPFQRSGILPALTFLRWQVALRPSGCVENRPSTVMAREFNASGSEKSNFIFISSFFPTLLDIWHTPSAWKDCTPYHRFSPIIKVLLQPRQSSPPNRNFRRQWFLGRQPSVRKVRDRQLSRIFRFTAFENKFLGKCGP